MRQIDDYFDNIPHGLQVHQLTTTRYKTGGISILERILRDKKVKDDDFKGRNNEVKKELLRIYAHCCAFCESKISKYDDAEHFRPKHAITGVNTEGYYWLAVEWSNLLIACKVCNNDYKKNHFPIVGAHILPPMGVDLKDNISVSDFFRRNHIRSTELQSEQALLLHPVLDNPEDYLFFEMNGTVSAKNGNIKGLESIQYYGLSDWKNREILIQARLKVIKNVKKKIYHAVDTYVNDTRLYQDLRQIHLDLIEEIKTKEPFSAVSRSCLVNFKAFFIDIDIFTGEQEAKLNRAYTQLKSDF